MNLNELWVPNDPVDEWAAWREYDLRTRHWQELEAARPWAEAREAWMREHAWLREKMHRTAEAISVQIVPAMKRLTATFTEAAEAFRSAMATIERVAPADRER